MKILYHHRTQAVGAEGVHILGIVNAFKNLGHEVIMVSPSGINKFGNIYKKVYKNEIKKNKKKIRQKTIELFSDYAPQIIFEIIELLYNCYSYYLLNISLKKFAPDIIYERYALFGISSSILSRKCKIKIVLEVNDATIIKRSRNLVLIRLAKKIEKLVLGNASSIVTISTKFKNLIADIHKISPNKIEVHANAVNKERFSRVSYPKFKKIIGLNNCTVIGVVGAFVDWHGLDFLIYNVPHLIGLDSKIKILLVGDGPVREKISAIIKQLNLDDYVRFTGFIPANDVPRYLSVMDICIMPNSNNHGSPIKIFEYMAMGKAVVAPRYEPIEEIILDGKTGLLFEPLNNQDFQQKIEILVKNKNKRELLGVEARKYVFSNHTWDINARKVLEKMK